MSCHGEKTKMRNFVEVANKALVSADVVIIVGSVVGSCANNAPCL